MAIDAISQYGGLLNSYLHQNIRSVSVDDVQTQDRIREQERFLDDSIDGIAAKFQQPMYVDNRSRMANLEDVSLSMNSLKDMDFLGKDNGIDSLDMEKAISDMGKDDILQEYQYFVGGQDPVVTAGEDGMVIRK